ncbi:MAG TPA: ACP S-malonyltransferase, partial [Candidatus Limnocylindrales bacterium]
ANRNAPGQVVVSGERTAIDASAEIAKSLGAKRAIVLPVSVAAHSPLMAEAAAGMRAVLASVEFHDPSAPLLANADARPLTTAAACRAELVDHLTAGVDWVRAVESMRAAGVTTFVEVGPGKVLTNLIKRIAPDTTAWALDEPGTPDRFALPTPVPA